jgi:hypothetical protein
MPLSSSYHGYHKTYEVYVPDNVTIQLLSIYQCFSGNKLPETQIHAAGLTIRLELSPRLFLHSLFFFLYASFEINSIDQADREIWKLYISK